MRGRRAKIALLADSPGRSMDWSHPRVRFQWVLRLVWVVLGVLKPTRDRAVVLRGLGDGVAEFSQLQQAVSTSWILTVNSSR